MATKQDLAVLKSDLVGEMHAQITRLVLWMVPLPLTALGITFGVAKLG